MSMSLPNQWCSGQILKARSQIGGPRVLCPQMSFSWHVLETSLCKQCWVHGTCSHPMAAESLSNKCLPCARPCFRDIRSEATSYNRHDSTTYVLLVPEARDARACWRRGCGYQPVTWNMKFGRRSYITRQQRMFMVMSEWSGPHHDSHTTPRNAPVTSFKTSMKSSASHVLPVLSLRSLDPHFLCLDGTIYVLS